MSHTVAILGASQKPERYSYKAMKMLGEYGYTVFLVNPGLNEIEGMTCYKNLTAIKDKIDTLTLYVGPEISLKQSQDILNLKPGRVIFNPGTESPELQKILSQNKIPFQEACTLVLLRTQQF